MSFDRSKQFKKDNSFGSWGEQIMIPFIEKHVKNDNYKLIFNHHSHDVLKKSQWSKYDLSFQVHEHGNPMFVEGKRVTFEIKTDKYEYDNGNLIFEKSCGRKKSGVFVTEATFFLYFLPKYDKDNLWLIKSSKLKDLLEKEFEHSIVSGGDPGSNTWMYKVGRNEIKEKFIELGGYIGSYNNYSLPDGMDTFDTKEKILFYAKQMKSYKNPLDFLIS